MRRAFCFVSFLTFVGFAVGTGAAFALSIEEQVKDVKDQATTDWADAVGYTCGGLLSPVDERVLAYYARKHSFPPFECILTQWCAAYDKKTGDCAGEQCVLDHWNEKGVPLTTLLQDCTSGTCVSSLPHQSCDLQYFASRSRHYECGSWQGPKFSSEATADCYTYLPYLHYDQSYYPFAYNCSLQYLASPVNPADPKGQASLIPPHEFRPLPRESAQVWEPAQGSNLTVPSLPDKNTTLDGSMTSLDLDTAALLNKQQVVHPTSEVSTRLQDYPDLSTLLGRLMHPPEVRLILPRGGFGLAYEHSDLFSKIFSFLQGTIAPSPVQVALGNTPDALLLAAQYLETIPLTEVRYVPVDILAPFASTLTLKELSEEWRTWLENTEKMAAAANPPLTLDATVSATVERNREVLDSYVALQDSLREYRLHFPQYLNALLTDVEASNRFFRDQWAAVNAQRLREWYAAYKTYLSDLGPTSLRGRLRKLYGDAAEFTKKCLVPACRLDAMPVAAGTQPWKLIPEGSDLVFGGPNAAFLPEEPRLWENYHDQVLQWHPLQLIGSPLPDLTLDFSEVYLKRVISVPVLKVEWQPLRLPYPPEVDAQNLAVSLKRLKEIIQPLPRLHPPLPKLTFPTIRLPDPATSLFLVPEAPKALSVWSEALDWKAKRLAQLGATCDTSGSSKNFLVHEFLLYGMKRDPAAVRAVTFVPWYAERQVFPNFLLPLTTWLTYYPYQALPGGARLPPLLLPSPCPECGTVRPQRYLRQHAELDEDWGVLQENFLRSIDEWNAQVRYFSVVPRNELESIAPPSKQRKNLLQLLFSPF